MYYNFPRRAVSEKGECTVTIWEPAIVWYGDAAVLNDYFPKWDPVTIELPEESADD